MFSASPVSNQNARQQAPTAGASPHGSQAVRRRTSAAATPPSNENRAPNASGQARGSVRPAPTEAPKRFATIDLLKGRWALAHAGVEAVQMGAYFVVPRLLGAIGQLSQATTVRAALLGANALLLVGLPIALMFIGQYITFRWTQARYFAAQDTLFAAVADRPTLWTEPNLREFATNELTSGAYSLASQTVWTAEMLITTGLRTAFAAAQLAFTAWTPGFVACLVGSCVVSYLLSKKIDGNLGETVELREARNEAQDSARSFWDNMVLNNGFNARTWRKRYDRRLQTLFAESWNSQRGSVAIGSIEQLSYMVPMALQQTANFEKEKLAGPSPLLPAARVSGILGAANAALAIAQSSIVLQSLRVIKKRHDQAHEQYCLFAEPPDMLERIHFDKITLKLPEEEKAHVATTEQALSALAQPQLWRMQGENGAGKTSFLLACKERYGDDCMVLPAKHSLDFDQGLGSSGEQVMAVFDKLDSLCSEESGPKLLLLDEWNANLDQTNEDKIRQLIDRWKSDHTIVEVIHR